MKKQLPCLLLSLLALDCAGQNTGNKTALPGVPSTGTLLSNTGSKISASGTSQIEKGYVYVLKKNSRIYYSISGNNMSTIIKTTAKKPSRIVYLQTNKTYQIDASGNLLINYTFPAVDHVDSTGYIQNNDKTYVETVITTVAANEIKVIPRTYRAGVRQADSGKLNIDLMIRPRLQRQLYSSKSARGQQEQEATQLSINKIMKSFEKFTENRESLLENTVSSNKVDKKSTAFFAHKIYSDDSVQNFYLTVLGNPIVGSPVYFLSIPYRVWQAGLATVPFKYRFGHKRAGDSIPDGGNASANLIMYLGKKWGRTRFYYDESKSHSTFSYMASVFAGPELIHLTDQNTFAKPVASHAIAVSAGLSLTAAIRMLHFGLFFGKDYALNAHTNWLYQGRFWAGFGVGINLAILTGGSAQ